MYVGDKLQVTNRKIVHLNSKYLPKLLLAKISKIIKNCFLTRAF